MNARDVILSRLRRRKPETALEREFYCSQEEYQVDLDMIWYRDWLFIGHDCEVPAAGDYMTVRGLRAPNGRFRPAASAVMRALAGLRESIR